MDSYFQSLTCHLLHYALLVVVPQTPRQFVIVHRRPILLDAPSTGHLFRLHQFKFHATARPHYAPATHVRLVQQGD